MGTIQTTYAAKLASVRLGTYYEQREARFKRPLEVEDNYRNFETRHMMSNWINETIK